MTGLQPSSPTWVAAAIADVPTLLVDHAHCERKAAQTAVKLISQHGDRPALVAQLSRLAREELMHFERVLALLDRRGIAYAPLPAAGYAAELLKLVRASKDEHFVDELLVCAIIEARSHERFERLIAESPDAELRAFYADLAEAEARHQSLYLDLAELECGGPAAGVRLGELLAFEARIISRPNQPLRMHSGG